MYKGLFSITKEHREQYYQSEEYKENKRKDEEFCRKRQEEKKLKRKESKQKYTKKERQDYARKCEEENNKIQELKKHEIELKKHELEKIQKIKQEEEQERNRIQKETEAILQKKMDKTDKYLKAEYLFYKLFDAIEKRKLTHFNLYKDYNLLLPIYNDLKKSSHCNHYLKTIPGGYILNKYFTSDKLEEIKFFEIFTNKEIDELIDIFVYKPFGFTY